MTHCVVVATATIFAPVIGTAPVAIPANAPTVVATHAVAATLVVPVLPVYAKQFLDISNIEV